MTNFDKVYLDDCIAVTGNDRTGRLLHRLWKWQFHTSIVRNKPEHDFDAAAITAGANVIDLQTAALSKAVDKSN